MREPVLFLVFAGVGMVTLGCGRAGTEPATPSLPAVEKGAAEFPEQRGASEPFGRITDDSDIAQAGYPPAITNSIGMKLRRIPAGEFMMGSRESAETLAKAFAKYDAKPEWFEDEYPRHRVRISKPFYLGVYEVTVSQFREFVTATDYKTDAEKEGGGYGWNDDEGTFVSGEYTWQDPGFPQSGDHPVVLVSWNDAMTFCRWLSQKEGTNYRLPTEAEWEYACRAGTTTRCHGGDSEEDLVRVANVSSSTPKAESTIARQDGPVFSAPVGKLQANDFGLYDMHGNVWEWCADWYGKDYYSKSPPEDPSGPPLADYHVLRGGSFLSGPDVTRSADRNWDSPDLRLYFDGFRVARTLQTVHLSQEEEVR